jgi:Skp family chaperone for outer membrane proteins
MLSKISLGINALLIIAVVVLFVRTSKSNMATSAPELLPENSAFTSPDGPKGAVMAYVNGDSLNSKYKFIVDKTKVLEQKYKQAELNVQKEYNARKADVDELMAYAQSGQMKDSEAPEVEAKLLQLQSEMQRIEEQATKAVMEREAELQNDLMERVNVFMDNYAKTKGIDYIVNYQPTTNFILYGNNAYDVTSEVIALLNAEYEKEQAGGK